MVRSSKPLMLVAHDLEVMYRVRGVAKGGNRTVSALKGVSFALRSGEALGVVGKNGAGKSTLLNALLGTVSPHRGNVYARSRPVAMQVHARMDLQLTGRQTAWIGLLSFGLTRSAAQQLLPEVLDFAEIDASLDRPIRTYSSGMRARLRFSIASARGPEILILDEALAVGDTGFKEKALQRIELLRDTASAVVMASHQLPEIRRTCTRALWIDSGRAAALGSIDDVLRAYAESYHVDG